MSKPKNLITTIRNLILISTLGVLVAMITTTIFGVCILYLLNKKTDLFYIISSSLILAYGYILIKWGKSLIRLWDKELEMWIK